MFVSIIADSINRFGDRLTTFVLEYPRYIHAELLTHRVFSKNSASSRAIPIQKFIEQVRTNPAIPSHWGANQKGMQAQGELSAEQKEEAKKIWLGARDKAIEFVEQLDKIGLHKQVANRLLEPWFQIRIILSSTEFENFFALRAHDAAHPDLKLLAYRMLESYNQSHPKLRTQWWDWHIPFGDKIDNVRLLPLIMHLADKLDRSGYTGDISPYQAAELEIKKKIAIARCARVSYLNFEGKDDYEADIALCDKLFAQVPLHLSPAEHVAQPMDESSFCGNFKGWKQYRKFFKDENLKDPRVKHD